MFTHLILILYSYKLIVMFKYAQFFIRMLRNHRLYIAEVFNILACKQQIDYFSKNYFLIFKFFWYADEKAIRT